MEPQKNEIPQPDKKVVDAAEAAMQDALKSMGFEVTTDEEKAGVKHTDHPPIDPGCVYMGPPPTIKPEEKPAYTFGPDHIPTQKELDSLRKRGAKSNESRDEYLKHCAHIVANPSSISSLETTLARYLRLNDGVVINVATPIEEYKPKGIKARFMFMIERALKAVAKWFTYRAPKAKSPMQVAWVAPEAPRTPGEILAEELTGAMLRCESGDPTAEYFAAIDEIIQNTKEENLVRLPGESKRQAIDRVVLTSMTKYQQQQAAKNAEDEKLGLVDGKLDYDEHVAQEQAWKNLGLQLGKTSVKPLHGGPFKVKLGTGTDLSKIARPSDSSLPEIASNPSWIKGIMLAKLDEERVAVDYNGAFPGTQERPAPVDPLLAMLKEERLNELLSKDSLTAAEKNELDDLTPGEVNVL
jgi:hypothetical protein